jgi:hypothetical protein
MLFLETIRYVDVGERQLIWGAALESLVRASARAKKSSVVDAATAAGAAGVSFSFGRWCFSSMMMEPTMTRMSRWLWRRFLM